MKILVAIDGSKYALRALKAAIDLSSQLAKPAKLGLVTVHDDTGLKSASRVLGSKAIRDYLAQTSEEQLAAAAKAADASGLEWEKFTATGPIAATIVDIAASKKFDLIILGAKGRGALRDLVIGSVAQRVSGSSTVPVMLVK